MSTENALGEGGSTEKPRCEFAGLRLGVLERNLLQQAPEQGCMAGLGIQAPNKTRPRQQAYLRAAKKLEEVGFVVREEVPVVVLTIDPRRERPVYRSGRFWRRKDPRRRQTVNRIFIWATPLGVGIRKAYEKELSRGDPIRWKTEKVELARGYERTHWANPSTHRESVEALRDGYSLPGAESEAGFR